MTKTFRQIRKPSIVKSSAAVFGSSLAGLILIPILLGNLSSLMWYNVVLSPPLAGQLPLSWVTTDWSMGPLRRVSSIAFPADAGRTAEVLGIRSAPSWTLAATKQPTLNGEIIFESATGFPFVMAKHARRHAPLTTLGRGVQIYVEISPFNWTGLNGPATEPTRWVWWGIVGNLIVWALIGLGAQRVFVAWRGKVERRRADKGLCRSCKYPLNALDRCPECGREAPADAQRA
jgi:hypothetical protein